MDETDPRSILDGDTLIHTDMTYKWFLELLGWWDGSIGFRHKIHSLTNMNPSSTPAVCTVRRTGEVGPWPDAQHRGHMGLVTACPGVCSTSSSTDSVVVHTVTISWLRQVCPDWSSQRVCPLACIQDPGSRLMRTHRTAIARMRTYFMKPRTNCIYYKVQKTPKTKQNKQQGHGFLF